MCLDLRTGRGSSTLPLLIYQITVGLFYAFPMYKLYFIVYGIKIVSGVFKELVDMLWPG